MAAGVLDQRARARASAGIGGGIRSVTAAPELAGLLKLGDAGDEESALSATAAKYAH